MTEERIKGILYELLGRLDNIENEEIKAELIEKYIRTVAAEAREEGIEEANQEWVELLEKAIKRNRPSD